MTKHLEKNERIKRSYLGYLKEAKRMDTSSVDMAAAAISHFDQWNHCRDFAKFHIEQAKAYKAYLAQQTNAATGMPPALLLVEDDDARLAGQAELVFYDVNRILEYLDRRVCRFGWA